MQPEKTAPASTHTMQDNALDGVRSRAVTVLHTVLLVLAFGGILLIWRTLVDADLALIRSALGLRTVLGFAAPATGPDWYHASAILVGPLAATILLLFGWHWYRAAWKARLERVWPEKPVRRRMQTIRPLRAGASADKIAYLRALAASPVWQERWDTLRAQTGLPTLLPADIDAGSYLPVSEAIYRNIEQDVSARALAIGLTVGAGHNPIIDACAILAASYEMQLYVLGELGKRPNFRIWRRIAIRCTASLFVNSYLNKADAMAVNLVIKKTALGLEVAGEALQAGSEELNHLLDNNGALEQANSADFDADELHGHLGGVAALVGEAAMFGMTIGSVALNQIARFIEKYGNEMMQGSIAGGIIYWHGLQLAADVLALDAAHRKSPAFRRTVRDAAFNVAKSAGEILRQAVRELRTTYRQRRIMAVSGLGRAAKNGGSKVAAAVSDLIRKYTEKK